MGKQKRGTKEVEEDVHGSMAQEVGITVSTQQQAINDHESNITYNPYPESCQSDAYQHAFHEGYSQQWNSFQQQESTQGSSVNVVNSPGATVSVNQESSQLQNPLQQLVHAACGFINCNPQPQSYEGP